MVKQKVIEMPDANSPKQVRICRRCHRVLKTSEAIERGMGKVCWEKSQQSIKKPLFEV